MKKFVLSATALLTLCAINAQGTLDMRSTARLRQLRLEQKHTPATAAAFKALSGTGATADDSRKWVGAFVTMAPDATKEDLEADGFNVMTVRGNLAVCMMPVDKVETMAASKAVKTMSLGRKLHTNMDFARKASNLDAVHSGDETPASGTEARLPYQGNGVILGVVDEGIDPGHVNFLNPDGTHRVGYLTHIVYQQASPGYAIRPFANETDIDNIPNAVSIANFTSDTPNGYHGTHTLGIAGGAYSGDVTMADYSKYTDHETAVPLIQAPNPYYGAAPKATLAAACGELVDEFIANGIDQICSYSYAKQMPAVISMSLGSNDGPHDVNSYMSRFLDLTMTKAPDNPNPPIICISAGNEGDHKIALKKELTSHDDVLKTMIWPYYSQYDPEIPGSVTVRQDNVAIYSPDATKLDIQAVVYNKSRGYRPALRLSVFGDGIGCYYISDEYFRIDETDQIDKILAKWFHGYVGLGGAIEPETGRFYAMFDYALQNTEPDASGKGGNLDDNYVIGFEIKVREGEEIPEGGLLVEAYSSGLTTEMYDYKQEGFDDGSLNGSISDMAVSPKLIVVGSFNSREDWLCLDGRRSLYVANDPLYFKPGYVSGFSSFGTLSDGRNLPTVCGPGSSVISSVNRYYVDAAFEEHPEQIPYTFQAKAIGPDGKENYWKQEPGTSMSTPFVAGSIACWLEADPTLDYAEVREIIEQTAVVDDQVRAGDPVQWGAGKFDALAGLKEVLRRKASSIGDVVADADSRLIITPAGTNAYTVFLGMTDAIDIKVFNMQGMAIKQLSVASDEVTIDLSDVAPGVYVISANGQSARVLVK